MEEPVKQFSTQTQSNLKIATSPVSQWLLSNYESAEGSSLPRRAVYGHYVNFCRNSNIEQLNAASFGKLMRVIFPNLKTRRLGTRGNSKYHYYGVRIKPSSDLRIPAFDESPTLPKDEKNGLNNFNLSKSNDTPFYQPQEVSQLHIQIKDFSISLPFLPNNVQSSLTTFATHYQNYALQFLQAVNSQSIVEIEKTIRQYCTVLPFRYRELFEFKEVTDYLFSKDLIIHDSILYILFSSIIKPTSIPNLHFVIQFVKNYGLWIENSLGDLSQEYVNSKLKMINDFTIILQKQAYISHFSHLLRGVFQTAPLISQMYEDMDKIDINIICQQIAFVDRKTITSITILFEEFKDSLKEKMPLDKIVAIVQEKFEKYIETAITQYGENNGDLKVIYHDALVKFSFYSNLLITDLTIKNSNSFSSFHVFRIFLEEFLSYYILKKSENPRLQLSSIVNNELPASVVISRIQTMEVDHDSMIKTFKQPHPINNNNNNHSYNEEFRWAVPSNTIPQNEPISNAYHSSMMKIPSKPIQFPNLTGRTFNPPLPPNAMNINEQGGGRRNAIVFPTSAPPFVSKNSDNIDNSNMKGPNIYNYNINNGGKVNYVNGMEANNMQYLDMNRDKIPINNINSESFSSRNNPKTHFTPIMNNYPDSMANFNSPHNSGSNDSNNWNPKGSFDWQNITQEYNNLSDRASTAFLDIDEKDLSNAKRKKAIES